METNQPIIDVVLAELQVRPITRDEEARYQAQPREHHYLGALPKIGETSTAFDYLRMTKNSAPISKLTD